MGVRLTQVGTQAPDFAGWQGPYTNLNPPAFNDVLFVDDSSTLYYWGFRIPGTGNNMFRTSPKATPTVYTQITLPIATSNNVNPILVVNDDLILLGLNNSTNARVYKYVPSTTTFTLLTNPQQGAWDSIFYIIPHPTNPDMVFVSGINAASSGNCGVYQVTISTDTWVLIGGGGTGWTANNNASRAEINIFQGRLYAGVGGGSINLANVFESSLISDGTPYTWTQIAGAGLNGSWPLGTKRNLRCFGLEGVLYAGVGGSTGGDAEVWRRSPSTGLWTQIGGDSLNGSWAAGTHTTAKLKGRGNILLASTSGTVAGDAEGWQFDTNTETWTQVAGDGLNGSWAATKLSVSQIFLDSSGAVIWVGGNNSAGTGYSFYDQGAAFTPGASGGWGVLSRKSTYPMGSF